LLKIVSYVLIPGPDFIWYYHWCRCWLCKLHNQCHQ